MNNSGKYLIWALLSVIGAFALGYIALNRGEQINALWIVVAAVCVYLIAYRFYGLYIAKTVLGVDPTRMTPAVRHNDGLDYVPTDKKVLFGHHFAAIAGAGPLVGPVLAAQMGYLPGMIWILAGVVLAGAVQDFMVLFVSTRRDGRSLGELVKEEMGPTAGVLALVACFMIMVIILAVLAMIVVKALTHSPWGTYTVAFTIPLAIFMGIYIRYLRPGRIGEVSVIGLVMLVFAIISGGWVAESPTWAPWFDYTGVQLTWILVGYGFVAAVLPVWLLLAPRDYLSTFLKIGTIVGLAIGILIMRPTLTMPALTKFVDGTGPVWTGNLFPFLFITIACGAVSGFHALISSGTTPKMLANESQACFIGYGGMLMESFVAIMALVAACIIDPGVYFAMNSPMAVLAPAGTTDVVASAAQVVSGWGFSITPDTLHQIASEVGEQSIRYRKFTNLTGPVYSIARGEVFVIRYESGAKDIITPLDRSAAAGKTQDTGIAAPSQQAMRQAVARAERRKRDKLWTFGLRAGAGVSFWSFKDDLKAQFGSSSEQVSFTSNPRLGFAASAFAERYFNRTGHGHLGVGVGYMQNGGSTEGTVQDESFTYDMRYDAFAVDVYYGMRPVKNGFYMRYGLRLQLPVGMKLRMGASPNLAGLIEGTDTDVALDTWYDVDKELRKSIVPAVNLTYGYTFGHADIGLQWAMAFASPHQEMGKSPWSLSLDFAYRF